MKAGQRGRADSVRGRDGEPKYKTQTGGGDGDGEEDKFGDDNEEEDNDEVSTQRGGRRPRNEADTAIAELEMMDQSQSEVLIRIIFSCITLPLCRMAS